MKNIKKIGKTVATSALLVGATLAGAATVSAQSSGSSGAQTLGDYPQPFVDQDGQVDTSIVVGENAKTVDVVGAIDIAGSLSQAAFTEETKTVSVSGAGGSWSATNGVTLDTRNDNLFYGNNISEVRSTLTQSDLDVLSETTFRDDAGDTTDVSSYLNVGDLGVEYNNDANELDGKDPALHIPVPSEGSVSNASAQYLYSLQANLGDGIQFNHTDVTGEDIELFGKTYTIASENKNRDLQSEGVLLYGNSQEVDINSGKSKTITVGDKDVSIEVVSVNSGDNAAIRVDGSLRSINSGETINVNGNDIRVEEIIKIGGSDSTDGVIQFGIGSQELVLQNGAPVEDDSGEEVKGTRVSINGGDGISNTGTISSLEIFVGSESDDEDAITAGETFSHSLFEGIKFHFGGLNPDASENDSVGEVMVQKNGDEDAQLTFTAGNGDETTVNFLHEDSGVTRLADEDNNSIATAEGQAVPEDGYFTSDAGDFDHMWQVTSVDRDGEDSKATIEDVVTGSTVDIDLDGLSAPYEGTEIIDGQKYYFSLTSSGLETTWGTNAGYQAPGAQTDVYTPVDTESGASVAFTDTVTVSNSTTIELPSTESSDGEVTVDTNTLPAADDTFNAGGQVSYELIDGTGNNNGVVTFGVEADQDGDNTNSDPAGPSALVLQPQDNNDEEHGFVLTNSSYSSDGYDFSGSSAVTHTAQALDLQTYESDDNMRADYTPYGTFVEQNTENEGSVTLNIPAGQSTVGAAVTGADGELSAEGGGSGSVTSQMPAGWPSTGMLDSDVTQSDRQGSNMILVGGPSVNGLVQDLVEANKTMAGSEYTEGQAVVQQIDNAFAEGQDALVVAGYSGEDTRSAASFISNYADHSSALKGKDKVTINTAQGNVVQ